VAMTSHNSGRATVDPGDPLPRYAQARRFLEELIRLQPLAPGDQLPSERDLAADFGVSQMTMNRAIQDMVREGLLYREVGRGTFVLGQNGKSQHDGTLGLVTLYSPGTLKSDPYGGEVLRAVHSAAVETGWHLLLVHEPLYQQGSAEPSLVSRADGFLFMSPEDEAIPYLTRLREEGVPYVAVGSSWLDEPIPAVDSDNILGARQAVEHLASLGHRRIGMIGGPENLSNSMDRHRGFLKAVGDHGLTFRDDWFLLCDHAWDVTARERARIVEMVCRADGPTALFAAGYSLAMHAMGAVQEAGLTVPADVSVMGFDENFSAAYLNPPLSTVAQPLDLMGRRAVERLEAMVRGEPDSGAVERMPTRMIIRGSCSHPRIETAG
jgi:DNA-binding LacI/PurR family transcriptional regulator